MRFDRVKKIFGDKFSEFEDFEILIFGVGGVGSFALDCLYRTGFKNIKIIDFDIYDETNLNRQLWSDEFIGKSKVESLLKKYPEIRGIEQKVTAEWVENFDFGNPKIVIDAVDDVSVKVALAHKFKNKLISSMGSGGKISPIGLKIDSIWKTEGDPLARSVRNSLRKSNFNGDFKTVFLPTTRIGEVGGSFMGVTASFGLAICSEVVYQTTSSIK